MDSEIYGKILNDEGFLNDLWNKYGAGDKLETLKLSGWTQEMIEKEWLRVNSEELKRDLLRLSGQDELFGSDRDNKNEDSNLEPEN